MAGDNSAAQCPPPNRFQRSEGSGWGEEDRERGNPLGSGVHYGDVSLRELSPRADSAEGEDPRGERGRAISRMGTAAPGTGRMDRAPSTSWLGGVNVSSVMPPPLLKVGGRRRAGDNPLPAYRQRQEARGDGAGRGQARMAPCPLGGPPRPPHGPALRRSAEEKWLWHGVPAPAVHDLSSAAGPRLTCLDPLLTQVSRSRIAR